VGAVFVHGLLLLMVWLAPLLDYLLPAACTAKVVPPSPKLAPLEIVLEPPPAPAEDVALNEAEERRLEEMFQTLPEEIQREYIDIDGLAKKKNLSKRALLESWEDSVAGARKPGKGDSPLPSQEGRDDLPFLNFKDQRAVVGDPKKQPGAEASPKLPLPLSDPAPIYKPEPIAKPELSKAKPEKIPKTASVEDPEPKPEPDSPAPTPLVVKAPPPELKIVKQAEEDQIAMFVLAPKLLGKFVSRDLPPMPAPEPKTTPEPKLKPTPAPTPKPTPEPVAPTPTPEPKPKPEATPKPQSNQIEAKRMASLPQPTPVQSPGFAAHMEKRKVEGGAAPEGDNGVDAIATDRGRYVKALNQAVGSRWTYYVRDARQASLITAGSVTMRFAVNSKGKFIKVKVTDNTSNSAHATLCERAFFESQPDIDPPPRELLRNGVFEDSFTFTLY
jgi:outer membrane biosynthesis protein TonB